MTATRGKLQARIDFVSMNSPSENKTLSAWPYAALLALIMLVVYGRVCNFRFLVWDDPTHVVDNRLVNPPSAEGLATIWQQPYWGLYVPLSYTFFSAEASIARKTSPGEIGSKANPAVFHVGNLMLHVGCVLLVFVLLRRLFGHNGAAFAGALLFGLHPLQVESVAWVSETRGVLCAFFSLVAILEYLRFGRFEHEDSADSRMTKTRLSYSARLLPPMHYSLATLSFAAALLCKPAAVALPLVVGILAVGLLRHRLLRTLILLSPWFAMALGVTVLTKILQPGTSLAAASPYWARPMLAGDALTFYINKLVAPVLLIPDYGRSPGAVMSDWTFYFAWLVPAALFAAFACLRNRRIWLVASGIFVCWLLPVLGFVAFDYQRLSTVADRYVYLSMLGPALALSWFLSRPRSRRVVIGLATLLCIFAAMTFHHVSHWRDDESLLEYTLAVNPGSVMANCNLGFVLSQRGRHRAAVYFYEKALKTDPKHDLSHLNLGWALFSLGDVENAKQHLFEARRLMPDEPWVYFNLGSVAMHSGDDPAAAAYFEEAIKRDPRFFRAHANLANVRHRQGRAAEAMKGWQTALQLVEPNSKEARKIRRAMEAAEQR